LTAIAGGKTGLRKLFRRLLIWRVGIQWWAFAVLFLVPATLGGMYLHALFGGPAVDLSRIPPLYEAIPGLIILTITSGFAEELGWRGFLLPRLQSRYNSLVSTIIITAAWGLWHWPLFIYDIEGLPYFAMTKAIGFAPALLGFTATYLLAWSIQYTWIYNNTKGSLLLISVLHGSQLWIGFLMDISKPVNFFPLTVVMAVASIIIVLAFGMKNLSRSNRRQILEASP
jgi:membrane protease YdiL (CAAX protease family)